MITPVDLQLCRDLGRFDFKFCCEECIHYEPTNLECSLGYCSAPHRARPLELGGTVVFCKTFELF